MLISDPRIIGNKLLAFRKKAGLTQREAAESAGVSLSTWLSAERGDAGMKLETLLRICAALNVTPDMLLTQDDYGVSPREMEILSRLDACSTHDKETALRLIEVFMNRIR